MLEIVLGIVLGVVVWKLADMLTQDPPEEKDDDTLGMRCTCFE